MVVVHLLFFGRSPCLLSLCNMGRRREQGIALSANLVYIKQFAGWVIRVQWCPAILQKEFSQCSLRYKRSSLHDFWNDCTRRSVAPFVAGWYGAPVKWVFQVLSPMPGIAVDFVRGIQGYLEYACMRTSQFITINRIAWSTCIWLHGVSGSIHGWLTSFESLLCSSASLCMSGTPARCADLYAANMPPSMLIA